MSFEVTNLCFSYGCQEVLNDLSFTAQSGEFLSILGPNGAGKSTLLRCMLGLNSRYTGTITMDGKDIKTLSHSRLARQIAYIPQAHYQAFSYSVFTMVLMGTSSQVSAISSPGSAQRKCVDNALERMGIPHLAEKSFARISGGERQLVLIARALAQDAKTLILDEPTANLDYGNQLRVMEQSRSLVDDGYTIISSTHNPEQAFLFSDHVLVLKDGTAWAFGSPNDTITSGMIKELYNADVEEKNLHDGKVRVFVPKFS